MNMSLAQRWWIVAARGVAAIGFGVLTLVAPASSLVALVMIFGAYAIVDGGFNLGLAIRGAQLGRRWGSLIFQGVVSLIAGVLTLLWPGISALVLLMIIAAWAVVGGASALVAAVRLRKQIRNEWLLALSGLLSIALGVMLFLFPVAGALVLVIWIGAFAIVNGGLLLALAFRLRAWNRGRERDVPVGGGLHVPA
jgi:uncharacterized membrane protein HdeD (DUF308 family)